MVTKELIFVSQSRRGGEGRPVCLISWMNLRTERADEDRKKVFAIFFFFFTAKIYIICTYRLSFFFAVSEALAQPGPA